MSYLLLDYLTPVLESSKGSSQHAVRAKSADFPARIVGRKLRLRKLKALRLARGYQGAEPDRRLFCGFGLASKESTDDARSSRCVHTCPPLGTAQNVRPIYTTQSSSLPRGAAFRAALGSLR